MGNVFTKTDLDLSAPLSPAQGLIMISSYPKSGNTWSRMFFYALNTRTKEIDLKHFSGNASLMDAQKSHYGAILGVDPNSLSDAQIAKTVPLVQKFMALSNQDRTLVKSHMANGEWGGVRTIDFNVVRSVVYVLRNPLDIVASYAAHMGISLNAAVGSMCKPGNWLRAPTMKLQLEATQMPQLMGSWSEHVAGWTGRPDPRVTVVRYEDLKADPATHFKRMSDGVGIQKTRAEVVAAASKTDFAQIQRKEAAEGFKESVRDDQKFFRSGKSGGWREELNEKHVKHMIRTHAFQMNRFGYIPAEYLDFAKEVIAESQTAKHFIGLAKKEQAAQNKKIRRRAKPVLAKSATKRPLTVNVPSVGVMFPSAIKASEPNGQ